MKLKDCFRKGPVTYDYSRISTHVIWFKHWIKNDIRPYHFYKGYPHQSLIILPCNSYHSEICGLFEKKIRLCTKKRYSIYRDKRVKPLDM